MIPKRLRIEVGGGSGGIFGEEEGETSAFPFRGGGKMIWQDDFDGSEESPGSRSG